MLHTHRISASDGVDLAHSHGGMVLARSAPEEIWPLITRWLAGGSAAQPSHRDPLKEP